MLTEPIIRLKLRLMNSTCLCMFTVTIPSGNELNTRLNCSPLILLSCGSMDGCEWYTTSLTFMWLAEWLGDKCGLMRLCCSTSYGSWLVTCVCFA